MMFLASLLFVLCHQVSTHEYLYSEIEHLGGSCYPWDSCKLSRSEEEDHLWGNNTCECGEHCIRYGTCCADSPYIGRILHVPYRGETCKKLTSASDAVVMVSRCPDRWRNGFEILEKCGITDNMEDPVSMVPVTSLETNVTYKNYFCAVCNYDYRNIYLWNISMEIRAKQTVPSLQNVTDRYFLENMIYNTKQKSWGLVVDGDFYKSHLRFHVPTHLRKLIKKCYRNTVTSCDPLYANNNDLQYKCFAYYSPIQVKEDGKRVKKYRNIHCAVCNNANITDKEMNLCKLEVHIPKKFKPNFSFALLLDINQSDGELVGLKKFCDKDQKWDPFFKKCRSLLCAAPGYVVKDGRCVPDGAVVARY